MRLIRKFLGLSQKKQQRLLLTWAWLLGVRFSLWVLPFSAVRAALIRPAGDIPQKRARSSPPIEEIVAGIQIASRFVPRATCLTQALVAHRLLTRAGHEAELQIGLGRGEGGFIEAHAWVENRAGPLIGDIGLERFTRMRMVDRRQ